MEGQIVTDTRNFGVFDENGVLKFPIKADTICPYGQATVGFLSGRDGIKAIIYLKQGESVIEIE